MYPVKTLVLAEPLPLTSLVTYGQVSSRSWPQLISLAAGWDVGSRPDFGEILTVELITCPTFPPSKEESLQFKHYIRESTARGLQIRPQRPKN